MQLLELFGLVSKRRHNEIIDAMAEKNAALDRELTKAHLARVKAEANDPVNSYTLKELYSLKQQLAQEKLRHSITDELELLAGLSGWSPVAQKMQDAIYAYKDMQEFIQAQKREMFPEDLVEKAKA